MTPEDTAENKLQWLEPWLVSEGDTPVPLSPSGSRGKEKAENYKRRLEAIPEASRWQAIWEVRLPPLHLVPNAGARYHSEHHPVFEHPCFMLQSHSCQSGGLVLTLFISPPSPANPTGNQKFLPIWAPHRLAQEERMIRGLGNHFPRAHLE